MLTTNLEMMQHAKEHGYAIPAINTQGGNYDIIRAICYAAEEMRSPIILAHYVSTGAYSGHDWFVEVAEKLANEVSVPVSIHLDHGESFDICMEALQLGFTSIMIDGSTMPVKENAAMTEKVAEVARCFNVPVEAEIGELLRFGTDGEQMENTNTANPEEVKEFLDLCSPDILAVGIGNAHGFYKGDPDIDVDVLRKIREFSDIPFVLHGCTGMKEAIIEECIGLGVVKINFGTHIRYKYMEHLKDAIDNSDHQGHSWKVSQYASDKLKEDVKEIIKLSGSNGRI